MAVEIKKGRRTVELPDGVHKKEELQRLLGVMNLIVERVITRQNGTALQLPNGGWVIMGPESENGVKSYSRLSKHGRKLQTFSHVTTKKAV